MQEIGGKLRKRVRTLLVPYLLWNVIFVMWYVVLKNLPGLERFNNSVGMLDRIFNASPTEALLYMFIVPAAFQLWFLRDLIGMLMLSPLLWWITKRQWMVSLALAILSTVLYPSWIIYFWVGLIIAMRRWDIEGYPHSGWAVVMGGTLYLGYAAYVALGYDTIRFMEIVVNFIGLYLLWYLYDLFSAGRCLADRGLWKYICGYSFFIYCFHEPAFNIIKKLALVICGSSEAVLIFFYFINPWIMVAMAVVIA